MIRLLILLIVVGACSPSLARDCPPGTIFLRDRCVALPAVPPAGVSSFFSGPGVGSAPSTLWHAYGARPPEASPLPEAKRLVPVRAYLGMDAIPPAGVGAYGLVVLRARPTDADRPRLRKMCQAFTATLARQAELPASVAAGDQMLTVWPLQDPQNPRALDDDCDYLLGTYALPAGDAAVADATRQGYSFSGRGPYLVGWSPSDTRGVKDKLALVVDMSNFDSQDSFNTSVLFWKQKVVEDPALWRHGFSAERFRLSVHDFADRYGQAFLDAFKLVGPK